MHSGVLYLALWCSLNFDAIDLAIVSFRFKLVEILSLLDMLFK